MNPFDVDTFVATAGVIGIMILLFVETGLLIGFIFPGDSLLFTAGVFAAQPQPFADLWVLLVIAPLAAVAGDQCGYFLGAKGGPVVLRGRIGRFIGPGPIKKTQAFFDKFGPVTVLFARFIGIVRTLTPLMAGLSHMKWWVFTLFSILGCYLWVGGLIMLGYFLGAIPIIRDHAELLIIGSLLTLLIPTFITIHHHRKNLRTRAPELEEEELAGDGEADNKKSETEPNASADV